MVPLPHCVPFLPLLFLISIFRSSRLLQAVKPACYRYFSVIYTGFGDFVATACPSKIRGVARIASSFRAVVARNHIHTRWTMLTDSIYRINRMRDFAESLSECHAKLTAP
jgi:hypothetical protein